VICVECDRLLPPSYFRKNMDICRICTLAHKHAKEWLTVEPFSGEDLWKIGEAFRWRCAYCGKQLHPGVGNTVCFDHLMSLGTAGGYTARDNLIICCRSCNSSKNEQLPEEFCSSELMEYIYKTHPFYRQPSDIQRRTPYYRTYRREPRPMYEIES